MLSGGQLCASVAGWSHQAQEDDLSDEASPHLDGKYGPVGPAAVRPVAEQQLEHDKDAPAAQEHHHLCQHHISSESGMWH